MAFVVLLATTVSAQTPAPAMPPGISRTALIENATVMMARLRMAPGARETVHTHPFSAVVVQLDPGEVEMRIGTRRDTTRWERGKVEFIAAEIPHAAANVGTAPFDVVTIALKPDRKPGGEQPPSPAPAGITRTPLLDNKEARATRAKFDAGAREPVHSHPYDMVLVQLTPGRVEVLLGSDKTVKDYAAGDVVFLPRDVPHAVSNAGKGPFELVSVGVK